MFKHLKAALITHMNLQYIQYYLDRKIKDNHRKKSWKDKNLFWNNEKIGFLYNRKKIVSYINK